MTLAQREAHTLCVYDHGAGPALYVGAMFNGRYGDLARVDGATWGACEYGLFQEEDYSAPNESSGSCARSSCGCGQRPSGGARSKRPAAGVP